MSYVQFEGEDKHDLRKMIENDLIAEQQLIPKIRERIDFARENRDHGIDDLLKDILESWEACSWITPLLTRTKFRKKCLSAITVVNTNSFFPWLDDKLITALRTAVDNDGTR